MSFNLTKYLSNNPLLQEAEKILTPRRSKEERAKKYNGEEVRKMVPGVEGDIYI
jgi:hypothetical protein